MVDVLVVDGREDRRAETVGRLTDGPDHWVVSGVAGATAALDRLRDGTLDVLVTRLDLGTMDGPTLLGFVQRQRPHVARILVSDDPTRDDVVAHAQVAHHSVPTDQPADELIAVVERTSRVLGSLTDPRYRSLVSGASRLATSRTVHNDLVELLSSSEADVAAVAELISHDVGLSTKLLRIVNSAWFGLRRRVDTLPTAVSYIGLESVEAVVLTAATIASLSGVPESILDRFERRSFVTAALARRLGREHGIDDAFVAGLLSNVGTLLLLSDEHLRPQVLRLGDGPIARERSELGITHADVGAALLDLWSLPYDVVEAVALHHEPARAGLHLHLPGIVHLASCLAEGPAGLDQVDERYVRAAGLGHSLAHAMEVVGPDTGPTPEPEAETTAIA